MTEEKNEIKMSVFERLSGQISDNDINNPSEEEEVESEETTPESTDSTPLQKPTPIETRKKKWARKEKETPSTQVWLTRNQRSIAKIIGGGKISNGIKEALDYYAKNHKIEETT